MEDTASKNRTIRPKTGHLATIKKGKATEKRRCRHGKWYHSDDVSATETIVKILDVGARNYHIVKAINVPESNVVKLTRTKDEVKKAVYECSEVKTLLQLRTWYFRSRGREFVNRPRQDWEAS